MKTLPSQSGTHLAGDLDRHRRSRRASRSVLAGVLLLAGALSGCGVPSPDVPLPTEASASASGPARTPDPRVSEPSWPSTPAPTPAPPPDLGPVQPPPATDPQPPRATDPVQPPPATDLGSSPHLVCDLARAALESVRAEGTSTGTFARVEEFLAAADAVSSDHVDLLYQAWQVGDAHRGSAPELVLEPALTNMVDTCSVSGY